MAYYGLRSIQIVKFYKVTVIQIRDNFQLHMSSGTVLKLECAFESSGNHVEMQILIVALVGLRPCSSNNLPGNSNVTSSQTTLRVAND